VRQIRRAPPGRAEILRLVATGLILLGINYALIYWGAQFIPSGLTAILQAATPIFALALGWLLGSERVTVPKVVGLTAGLAGIVTIFGAEARVSGGVALAGSAAVLGGAFCVALAYVAVKTYSKRQPPLVVMAVQVGAAVVPMTVAALTLEGAPSPTAWSAASWTALLYLALVGSVAAFCANYWLLQRIDASSMLMMGIAEVPIAVVLGAVFLSERLPPLTLAGAALVLAGVAATLPRAAARGGRAGEGQ
jgi:drug/metabolite transporter (DMT)-like permease